MTHERPTAPETSPATAEIACVGDNCVDVTEGPGALELAGGNAFNVAVELARTGRHVAYHGAVGDDAAAEIILAAAAAANVDATGILRVAGPTGRTVVAHRDGGERVFVSEDYGVSAGYRLDPDTVATLATARWIHLARQPDAEDWAPELRAVGARLSADFGDAADLGAIAPLCGQLDAAFFSEPDGDGAAADTLLGAALATGASLVVVTLGAAGSVAGAAGGERWRVPAVAVAPVIDTLGAGDAFIAACVGALLDGDDVEAALRAGAVAGAAACTRIGLASPLPTTEVPA